MGFKNKLRTEAEVVKLAGPKFVAGSTPAGGQIILNWDRKQPVEICFMEAMLLTHIITHYRRTSSVQSFGVTKSLNANSQSQFIANCDLHPESSVNIGSGD